jgi:putative transposase
MTPWPLKDRLHHRVLAWMADGATFHLRIRCAPLQLARSTLSTPPLSRALLDSVHFYHARRRWCCFLSLLMPDHLHALIAFPREEALAAVVHDWKSWHKRTHDVEWQDGFFDHRIRDDHQLELRANYIRQNPVVKNLCAHTHDWPWFCEPHASEMGGHVPVPAFTPSPPPAHPHAGAGTRPPTP